jgi:hypothetical protein
MHNLLPLFKPELYLDPGSGSFLIQLIAAGIVGGGFIVKIYWKKIKSFFTGKKDEPLPVEPLVDDNPFEDNDPKHD